MEPKAVATETSKPDPQTGPKPIIIGFTSEPISNLWELLESPKPDGRITSKGPEGDEKREASVRQKKEEIEKEAGLEKFTGRITNIFAVDPVSGGIFDSRKQTKISPLVSFAAWLLKRHPGAFPQYGRATGQRGVALYGFGVKNFVRICGVQAGLTRPNPVVLPLGFWYGNEDCFDPYEMLIEADRRAITPLCSLLTEAQILHLPGHVPHVDCAEDARLAAELVYSCNMANPDYDKALYTLIYQELELPAELQEEEEADAAVTAPAAEEEAAVETPVAKPKKSPVLAKVEDEDEEEDDEEEEDDVEDIDDDEEADDDDVDDADDEEEDDEEEDDEEEDDEEEYKEEDSDEPAPTKKRSVPAAPASAGRKIPRRTRE